MRTALKYAYYFGGSEALPDITVESFHLLDAFDESDGTSIVGRSPDVGNVPTVLTGTHSITGKRLTTTVSGIVLWDLGASDYILETLVNITNTAATMRVDFRYLDATPSTSHRLIVDLTGGNIRLREYDGSPTVPTNTWTAARTVTTGVHLLKIVASGASIKVYYDGALYIDETTVITTGNFMGVLGETTKSIEYIGVREGSEYTALEVTSYCWFARPKAIYNASAGKTWIGQVHNDGSGYSQHIVTLDNATGEVTSVEVGTVVQMDDHNEPTILVRSSDNKLFTCYAEHGASTNIRYRLSTNALDASSWGAESTKSVGGTSAFNVTYPSCFEASNGDIYIFYRETTNGYGYVKSTDGGVTFGTRVLFFFGDGARGYLIAAQDPNNADLIHFAATGGHPDNVTDTSCFHFYFDCSADTLHKSDGTDVTAEKPLTGAADMTLVMLAELPDTSWVEDITIDSNGRPRMLMTFLPDSHDNGFLIKDLYYSEWTGSAWSTPHKIHEALSGYMEDDATNESRMYPPNSCFDPSNPNTIYACKAVNGVSELHQVRRVSASSFTTTQITFNSKLDQWRPFKTAATQRNLFWLNKKHYNHWLNDYNQDLMVATV